jgi:hypothetical protein
MFPSFTQSRLLVHIAFHYGAQRIPYLRAVLEALSQYGFLQVDVVIDTNSLETGKLELGTESLTVEVQVHSDLKDPFLLTWKHRAAMLEKLADYDYFMYLEDDLQVPYSALQRWRSDMNTLEETPYIRGFLRTEIDGTGNIVSTDQRYPVSRREFKAVRGAIWYYPENPYQGFWICSKSQMAAFIQSKAWIDGGDTDWGVRERAAAGPIWAQDRSRHSCLIPMTGTSAVHPDALVDHLPNNYAMDLT